MMITVKTNNTKVFIGEEVLKLLEEYLRPYQSSKIFILLDENTLEHCFPILATKISAIQNAEIIEINSGEENKILDICYQIWSILSEYQADRSSLIINLGGGVITDMGGFVASTYKRGIDFINVPTTLLSQIDASVGGKTGVDFGGYKNLIGVFNEANGVFIYPPFLKTLDKRQMLSGYAEALKHALIKDEVYWQAMNETNLTEEKSWEDFIAKSVKIKNEIVLADPFEKNERKLLNFGHTIGHAIESCSLKKYTLPLLHGEAIAIGLICESYISSKFVGLSTDELKQIVAIITTFYSPYKLDENCYHELIELMKNDKKNENDTINFTLIERIGKGVINQNVDLDLIVDALNFYTNLNK